MRNTGILVIVIIWMTGMVGCKSSSVSGKSGPSEYKEELGHLRPNLDEVKEEPDAESFVEREVSVNYVEPIKEELDSVNQIIIANNRQTRYEDGFTIQIYTGNDRQAANQAQERALIINPDLTPVISYHQPSYKVKVGEYLDRLEAHAVYEELKKEFPLALLIPERIKINYD